MWAETQLYCKTPDGFGPDAGKAHPLYQRKTPRARIASGNSTKIGTLLI